MRALCALWSKSNNSLPSYGYRAASVQAGRPLVNKVSRKLESLGGGLRALSTLAAQHLLCPPVRFGLGQIFNLTVPHDGDRFLSSQNRTIRWATVTLVRKQ